METDHAQRCCPDHNGADQSNNSGLEPDGHRAEQLSRPDQDNYLTAKAMGTHKFLWSPEQSLRPCKNLEGARKHRAGGKHRNECPDEHWI